MNLTLLSRCPCVLVSTEDTLACTHKPTQTTQTNRTSSGPNQPSTDNKAPDSCSHLEIGKKKNRVFHKIMISFLNQN